MLQRITAGVGHVREHPSSTSPAGSCRLLTSQLSHGACAAAVVQLVRHIAARTGHPGEGTQQRRLSRPQRGPRQIRRRDPAVFQDYLVRLPSCCCEASVAATVQPKPARSSWLAQHAAAMHSVKREEEVIAACGDLCTLPLSALVVDKNSRGAWHPLGQLGGRDGVLGQHLRTLVRARNHAYQSQRGAHEDMLWMQRHCS